MGDSMICWLCGEEMPYSNSLKRTYCSNCKEKAKEKQKKLINDYLKHKTLIMYENALEKMEKQKIDMSFYYEACQVVKERALKDYNTFDSALEIMTCIELINNEIMVKPQVEFGKYKVDFMLPDLKIILEIDGYWHNNSKKMLSDAKRDIKILNQLGPGWEIIRLKTTQIEKRLNTLVDNIKKIYNERQLLRKRNRGILPDNYDDYTKILYKNILGIYKYDNSYLTDTEKEEMNSRGELNCYKKHKRTNDYDKLEQENLNKIKNYFENKKNGILK